MAKSSHIHSLQGQRVLLCVGGGIAAYKALELVRGLRKAGAEVQVAMTAGAQQFVMPLSFQALSGNPVRTSLWDSAAEAAMGHIELARWADQVVVAPATANLLAKLATGTADDLVTTLCLATIAPISVVPAMNHMMWLHPATQANMAVLGERGVQVIGPGVGDQACGEFGPGRLSEPHDILAALTGIQQQAVVNTSLQGKRVVISAGPTYEDLDPVRYLGNRSSGKMGYALASAAVQCGADVLLVSGPTGLSVPVGVERVNVRSAAQMREAVLAALPADIYIGAAAVSDYTPKIMAEQKIKKVGETLTLELVRTRDILAEVAAQKPNSMFVVGFAAETTDVEHYALGKLKAKQLDMIVANQVGIVGRGFESDDNAAIAYWGQGKREFTAMPKGELARELLKLIGGQIQG